MEKIEAKLKKFAKKDFAIREAIAKRRERLAARQNTFRVDQAIGFEPNPRWHGQEYQQSGHQTG
jgi:hypothetical protein